MSAPVVPPFPASIDWLPDLLEQLVTAEAEQLGDEPEATALIRFSSAGDGFDLGTKYLDPGEHPIAAIIGLVVPDDWFAFGVIAPGWATRWRDELDPVTQEDFARNRVRHRPSRSADRVRTLTAHVVARDGTEAGALAMHGEVVHRHGLCATDGPDAVTGATADVIRRALGVATPPAGFPPAELLAAHWLTGVVEQRWPNKARWDDIVAANPRAYEAASLAAAHPDEITWSTLRWSVVGGATTFGVDPTLAAWFDDGSFARWAITEYPPLDVLAVRVRELATASANREVRRRLRSWGLSPC